MLISKHKREKFKCRLLMAQLNYFKMKIPERLLNSLWAVETIKCIVNLLQNYINKKLVFNTKLNTRVILPREIKLVF